MKSMKRVSEIDVRYEQSEQRDGGKFDEQMTVSR
jgi:hypothetical protein